MNIDSIIEKVAEKATHERLKKEKEDFEKDRERYLAEAFEKER